MMQSDRDLVVRVYAVIQPVPGVLQQVGELLRNGMGCHADVPFGRPKLTRPGPCAAEHPPVELFEEPDLQR